MRCAPRELALAKSHLQFADVELDQGFLSKASRHLAIAEPNAHAAYDLSPPEKCAERGLRRCAAAIPTPTATASSTRATRASLEPEDKDGYLDEDGCPELDNDLDGILDVTADKCPQRARGSGRLRGRRRLPRSGQRQGHVADVEDQCPNEPGPPDGDRPGCPRKPALVVVTDKEIKITQQIHFEFDKDMIRPESFPILDAVVEVLQKNPEIESRSRATPTTRDRRLTT